MKIAFFSSRAFLLGLALRAFGCTGTVLDVGSASDAGADAATRDAADARGSETTSVVGDAGGAEATTEAAATQMLPIPLTQHVCNPACDAQSFCMYPPSDCAPNGGGCDAGSPAPSCEPLPEGCGGMPNCACLLSGACSSFGFGGTCGYDENENWVISCTQG